MGDISSLKSQLKDLGQQLVVISGERERAHNEICKLKVDNERLRGEKELLINKVGGLSRGNQILSDMAEEFFLQNS